MERLKAGYEKLMKTTDRAALKRDFDRVAAPMMKLMPVTGRQLTIGSRVVAENRQISEGGFAYVWLVHDVRTHEELVLKKMQCQDKAALAMAKREIQLLERLPLHPNLVQYYGNILLTEGKCKEVAMLFEFCPGGHLLNLLEKAEGRLSEKVILHTLSEVVAGVAVLHSFSPPVQHRDLKVENVLMGSDGHWKLLDFGSWSDERTEPGLLDKHALSQLEEQIGKYTTLMYRPPEMVDFYLEFAISEKVDIWMLGCILYTLMFYRHPFQDESSLAIANARYQWPSSPEHSEKLRDLTLWLLARDPANRPDAMILLSILENFAESSLPLPKVVLEQREHVRRLYDPQARGSCPVSRVQSPARSTDTGPEERKRSKPRKGKTSKRPDVWAEALPEDAWPAAAEPWAPFQAEPSSPSKPLETETWPAFAQAEPASPMQREQRPETWPAFAQAPDKESADPWSGWSTSTHATSGSQSPPRQGWAGSCEDPFVRPWPELIAEASPWPERPGPARAGSMWPAEAPSANVAPDSRLSPRETDPWAGVASPSGSPKASTQAAWPKSSPWSAAPASRSGSEREVASPRGSPWPEPDVFANFGARWPDAAGTGLPAGDPWGSPKASKPAFAWAAFE